MSCGVGLRLGLDPKWLWLWCRPAAVAPIRPLAWEPPYGEGAALEKAKKKKSQTYLQPTMVNGAVHPHSKYPPLRCISDV